LERIEGHVDGRGGVGFTRSMPEPLESGDEVLIEHRHFAIQDQSGFWESSNHPSEFTKSPRVIPTIPAEELDLPLTLGGEHYPAVVFLLLDPALTAEGASDVGASGAMSDRKGHA